MPEGESRFAYRTDEATPHDTLNRGQYAEAFARLAQECDTPMVIGLFGTWGVGKTSLMMQIRSKLDEAKVRSVWYDPWQHQFDESPALALLHTLVEDVEMQAEQEVKKLLAVIASAFGSVLLKATTGLKLMDLWRLGERIEEEQYQVREARVRLQKHFNELIEKARGKGRIVFFIDDLDRCMPPQTLAMLEALKLYLNLPGCVYFLGVDRVALERSIEYHYKGVKLSETSYLDKIVQLPFRIPPIAWESMADFVKPLLPEALNACQDLLVSGLGDNPRDVKRFINTLILNHQLALPLQIPGYDPSLLALLLLIQYRRAELYRLIASEPALLLKLQEETDEGKVLRDKHLGEDGRLRQVVGSVTIPQDARLHRYIYLTGVVRVAEEQVRAGPAGIELPALLAAHRRWRQSLGKEGRRADLSGADLGEANLRRADLRRADLSGAVLSKADVSGAVLREADLRGADLSGAVLSKADVSGANLFGAEGLTEGGLAAAVTDEHTTLPDGSRGPFRRGSGAHEPRSAGAGPERKSDAENQARS